MQSSPGKKKNIFTYVGVDSLKQIKVLRSFGENEKSIQNSTNSVA